MLDGVPVIAVSRLDCDSVVCYPNLWVLTSIILVHRISLEIWWKSVGDNFISEAGRIRRGVTCFPRVDDIYSVTCIIQADLTVILTGE